MAAFQHSPDVKTDTSAVMLLMLFARVSLLKEVECCRQLDAVMSNMQALESKLEARGINVKELGPLPYDYPSE